MPTEAFSPHLRVPPPDRCSLYVDAPVPCTASRINPFPSLNREDWSDPHVSRKNSVSYLIDPQDNRIKVAESTNESKTFFGLRSDPDIMEINDQLPSIKVDHPEARYASHTFDWTATTRANETIALLVKDQSWLDERDGEVQAAIIGSCVRPDFAQRMRVVTDEDFPEWAVRNARLITSVIGDPETSLDKQIRDYVEGLDSPIVIEMLALQFGGGFVAFRPIVRLIYQGTLRQQEPGLIDEKTWVVPTHLPAEASHAAE